jgi:hypothetical protein
MFGHLRALATAVVLFSISVCWANSGFAQKSGGILKI